MKRFSIFLSLIAVVFITLPYQIAYGDNSMVSMRIQSPGIQVGWTDYDWLGNGSLGRRIYATPNGGFHFIWMNGSQLNYRVYYNYFYPPSYWLGLTPLDSRVSRLGGLAQTSDGRAVVIMYVSVGGNIIPVCYIDAAEGAGSFTIYDIPVPDPADAPVWPRIGVDDLNYIYVSGSGTAQGAWWTMSTDQGATWADWNNSLGGVVLTEDNFDSGGKETWTTYNGKVALINNSGLDLSYHYWESTDHGQTWIFDTVFTPEPDDSVQGYIWHSAVYDNAGDLHVMFCCIDTTPGGGGGGAYGSGWRSQIRHWDSGTDQVTIVTSGWWATNPGPGAIHPTVSECQVAIDRVSGDLYCTWCQADTGADTSAYGYTNLEIYGAKSIDNGATWINHHNITNSHTPGAAPGDCDHDWWQSIAETTYGDTLAIFYMNDKDAGSFVMGEGGAFTDNPLLFYYYPFVGIEEHDADTPIRLAFNISPNPVVHRLNISYALPESGNTSLKLYSVDGRLVKTIEDSYKPAGVYTLSLHTSDLASGTYFVVLNTSENTISCPVIVVH